MKIGIITELSLTSVNYGNHLQAFALNQFLMQLCPAAKTETLVLNSQELRKYTSLLYWLKITTRGFLAKCKHIVIPVKRGCKIETRFQNFSRFDINNIRINDVRGRGAELRNLDYDIFIVGSDVVWYQWRGFVERTKYLDFGRATDSLRIAYAASFGKNYIPPENTLTLRSLLAKFDAISVRESTSISLLKSIGVDKDVSHVCDPTLLLGKEEWNKIESRPDCPEMGDNFCFAYLLGQNDSQRERIELLCKQEGLQLVSIPYINGYVGNGKDRFGDVLLENCSPQEWVWLIHHAQYVITDSFHGLAFSTIFSTKFLAVKRASTTNLNMRLEDYLETIDEKDKYIDVESVRSLCNFTWDFEKIRMRLEMFKRRSVDYLFTSLNIN